MSDQQFDNSSATGSQDPATSTTSRRTFLKAAGTLAVGSLAGALPVPVVAGAVTPPVAQTKLEQASTIISVSRIFSQLSDWAKNQGFTFDLSPQAIQSATENKNSLGCLIRAASSPNYRTGTDIVVTVDLVTEEVLGAQLIMGWSFNDQFSYQSLFIDSRDEPFYERTPPSADKQFVARLIYPMQQKYDSLSRKDVAPLQVGELVESGWPDEKFHGYRYLGVSNLDWINVNGSLQFRATELLEQFPDSNEFQRMVLRYTQTV